MKKRTPISSIMSTEVTTVNLTQSLKDVAEVIKTKHIHHVPVVSGTKVLGLISKVDLQKISFVNQVEGDGISVEMLETLSIEQVMSKNIKTVDKDTTIHEVAVIFSENDFHALPVLDGDKLVGIVSTQDLIKYLIAQF